ncbi:MAG: radical SAM protein [Candidatus Bipolaricaulota bacterium]|nr:radical SAM protein [Candidatus Bipolaricaulota bacterium]MBS3792823.1 radical SAM protein [Candidatus Bipolaricaulota bacterium]
MISISRLLGQLEAESDGLRYKDGESGRSEEQIKHHSSMEDERPVVVWNTTNACNLNCVHCYASSGYKTGEDELGTEEAREVIDDLAEFEVPVMLFSGGEPFLRPDLFELGNYCSKKGIRPVISTNGTLLDKRKAERAEEAGFRYIGVSVDGLSVKNDKFRGKEGCFERALEGIRSSVKAGLKTGLRFTLTNENLSELSGILNLVEEEGLHRFCLYHLVYAGKANRSLDVPPTEKRKLLKHYFRWTEDMISGGNEIEALSVGNYADAAFLYLYARRNKPELAEEILDLLKRNQGDGAGETIACIDAEGNVYPNQFWRDMTLGNVRESSFSDIWSDESNPILKGLRDKENYIHGRCKECSYFEICQGGSRVRAKAISGNHWAPDPGCYLSEEEIHGTS